jgi:hypothetical protein
VEVIIDDDTGYVYVKREETPPGVEPQYSHQFSNFGITMVWDGSGKLLGVEFASDRSGLTDVRTVKSKENQSAVP